MVVAKAREHRNLEDLFVDGFIDHFLEEDADVMASKARRLFPVLELFFRTLKAHYEQTRDSNDNANAVAAAVGGRRHSGKSGRSGRSGKLDPRNKSNPSVRIKIRSATSLDQG